MLLDDATFKKYFNSDELGIKCDTPLGEELVNRIVERFTSRKEK